MAQSNLRRADPNSVRKWNEYLVVSALGEGPHRISALARATGLTPAPLGEVLRGLEAKGWVASSRSTGGGPGRPAQVYSLVVPKGSVIGLDVGGRALRCVRFDLEGGQRAKVERRLPRGADEALRRRTIAEVTREALGDGGPLWLAGLSVTGNIGVDGRMVESAAMPELNGQSPEDLWAEAIGGRTFVVNDVRAAGYAEHRVGAARDHGDVLLIQLGRRPTLGLLFGGTPRGGAHGGAGDLSHNNFIPTEAGMEWLEPFRDSEDPIGDGVRAILDGDQQALAGVKTYIEAMAPSLALTTAVVDPGVVVLSGALTPVAPHFIDDLATVIRENVARTPPVRISELDQFSAAVGAGLAALQRLRSSLADPTTGVQPFTLEAFAGLPLGTDPTASDVRVTD
ncbi:hypothetical protein GCM10028820_02450 [Tessaracoccus terricola]